MKKNNESVTINEVATNNDFPFTRSLTDRFNAILNRKSAAVTTDNDGTMVTTLDVKLLHKLPNGQEKITVTNTETIASIERIQKLSSMEALTPTIKCVELYRMKADIESEFSTSIETMGYSMFNIGKKTIQQYVRIGQFFYDSEGNMRDERIPFLSTSQIVPLLARIDSDNENPLHLIAEMFTPDEDGHSLLHGTDGANRIKKALSDYDKGLLDIHGNCPLTNEELEARKAQEKADRKKQSTKESEENETNETESEKELSPIQSWEYNLGKLFTIHDNLISSFESALPNIVSTKQGKYKVLMERLTKVCEDIAELYESI